MYDENIAVLIVGGGSVGLSASVFLSHLGVPSLLVERHATTSIHPRARGLNYHTLELFRTVKLEEAIRAAGSALAESRYSILVHTLAEKEIRRFGGLEESAESRERLNKLTPTSWCFCAQDELEPILVGAARANGADLRFSTELISLEQDSDSVIAKVMERATGRQYSIRADYLIATDGASSPIRQKLGIRMAGRGVLGHYMGIYFRADLTELVRGREFIMSFVKNSEAPGTLSSINNRDRWVFNTEYDPEDGISPASFTEERCLELVRKAIGLPQLEVELLSVLPWEAAVSMAESYQAGRIFLAGDAVHMMPPAGAFGLNTGIQDVHNLAWKLASVTKGSATSSLLDTYEAERRPVGQVTVEQAAIRLDFRGSGKPSKPPTDSNGPAMIDDMAMIFGHQYNSRAVAGAQQTFPFLENLELLGQPGTRAPHLWLEHDGKRLSTLDLFDKSFVLLVGANGEAWSKAAQSIATERNLALACYRIGVGGNFVEVEGNWEAAFRVTSEGAVLVRPDGFVAWRSANHEAFPEKKLLEIFDQLLGQKI